MSALAVVLIVIGALLLLVFIGGLAAARRRSRDQAARLQERIAEADRALKHARAADKGWEKAALEQAARQALDEARPGWAYERLDLVLVDDRPGVTEDCAHFLAAGGDRQTRVVLTRREGGWVAERVE